MLKVITLWASQAFSKMGDDIQFAVIGGIIILFAQLLNAAIGVWKNEKEDGEFSWRYLIETFIREITFTILVMGGVAIVYMLEELAALTLVPGFDVGDVPAAALLLAYGANVLEKSKSIYMNLMFIMTGHNSDEEVDEIEESE